MAQISIVVLSCSLRWRYIWNKVRDLPDLSDLQEQPRSRRVKRKGFTFLEQQRSMFS
uniref:Uncharacterized protein n=1 Tax=Oryza brachyantha TaxID=4533 RepID=J3N833_ORYBR